MSAKDLTLHLDVPGRRLIRDFFSNLEIQPRDLVQGDEYNIRLIAVEPNPLGDPTRIWRYVSLPTSLYVGIGTPGAAPTSGTFTLTWGGDTTSALDFDATAAEVQSALNALASITSAGGVVVSAGNNGGPFQVAWNTAADRALITGTADALYPLSTITVYTARAGTGSLTEIQVIVLDRQPAALAETFAAIAAPSLTISTLQAGASGVPEIQKIAVSADAHDGSFTLTFSTKTTPALAWDIAAEDLQTALEALSTVGAGNVEVSGQFPEWTVAFVGTLTGDQPAMTGSAAGLIGPQGVEGVLQLATAGIEQLVNGETSVETYLEIAASISGAPVTLLQTGVTVLNDQIPNSPASGTGFPTYYTASEADALLADKVDKTGASIADIAADASTAHALNATFDDTEVESALNALGTKLNAVCAKVNDILTKLEAAALLDP